MFAARVPPFAFVLHKGAGKPPCAEAHFKSSESKGHDNRARRARGWRELCRRKRRGIPGKTNLFFSPVSLPTAGGFLEQNKSKRRDMSGSARKKMRALKNPEPTSSSLTELFDRASSCEHFRGWQLVQPSNQQVG